MADAIDRNRISTEDFNRYFSGRLSVTDSQDGIKGVVDATDTIVDLNRTAVLDYADKKVQNALDEFTQEWPAFMADPQVQMMNGAFRSFGLSSDYQLRNPHNCKANEGAAIGFYHTGPMGTISGGLGEVCPAKGESLTLAQFTREAAVLLRDAHALPPVELHASDEVATLLRDNGFYADQNYLMKRNADGSDTRVLVFQPESDNPFPNQAVTFEFFNSQEVKVTTTEYGGTASVYLMNLATGKITVVSENQ